MCSFEQSAFVSETSSEVLRNVCFCNEGAQLPQGFVLCISQILIFMPQFYDYYLSSSIFDLKISYILNKIKSPLPPVFLKPFLLDDVKNQTGLMIIMFTSDQYEMLICIWKTIANEDK